MFIVVAFGIFMCKLYVLSVCYNGLLYTRGIMYMYMCVYVYIIL